MRRNRCYIALLLWLLPVAGLLQAQTWQSTGGPYRATVQDMTIGRATGASQPTLYHTDGSAIYSSTDGGGSWIQTSTPGGNPIAIACYTSSPSFVLAAIDGRLRKSSDGGSSWNDAIGSDNNLHPLSLAISPANNQYQYLGLQKVCGNASMRRFNNAVGAWGPIDYFYGDVGTNVKAITTHPSIAGMVWAGGSTPQACQQAPAEQFSQPYTNGVFWSGNAGLTWLNSGNLQKNVVSMAAYTRTSTLGGIDYLFVATDDPVNKLYRTDAPTSALAPWTSLSFPGGMITDLRTYESQSSNPENNIYHVYAATNSGVYKSTDDGASWTLLSCNGTYDSDVKRIAIDPGNANTLFAGTPATIYKSTNGGSSWSDATIGAVRMPVSSAAGVNGTMMALSSSYSTLQKNTSGNWNNITMNCNVRDFRGFALKYKNSAGQVAFAAGLRQGAASTSSLWRTLDGGTTWSEISNRSGTFAGGRYNGVFVDPWNQERIYSFGKKETNDNVAVSINGGTGWERVSIPNNSTTNAPEIADFAIDPTNHQPDRSLILYAAVYSSANAGDLGLWKSANAGSSWSSLPLLTTKPVRAVALNPNMPGELYTAGGNAATGWWFKESPDGGSSWFTKPNMTLEVKKIVMDPCKPNSFSDLYVVARSEATDRIYRTSDKGTTWLDYTDNLPSPIYDLRADAATSHLYAATETGVYKFAAPTNITELVSPGNQTTTSGSNVVLTWNYVPGAGSYHVQIADNPDFELPVYNIANNLTTSYTASLAWGTTYYWRVAAKNCLGQVSWTAPGAMVWTFTTPVQGASITLSASTVVVNGVRRPKLSWVPVGQGSASFTVYRYPCPYGTGDCGGSYIPVFGPSTATTFTDNSVEVAGKFDTPVATYYYEVRATTISNKVAVNSSSVYKAERREDITEILIPEKTALMANYPNPFNPTTSIKYQLSADAHVKLKVIDMLGREVALLVDEFQQAGYESVEFDASTLPSGIYFYRLTARTANGAQGENFTDTKKMLLLR